MQTPPNLPYQAYRSKRHSRNISASHLSPNVSPPPQSRPQPMYGNGHGLSDSIIPQQRDFLDTLEKHVQQVTRVPEEHRRSVSLDMVPHYEPKSLIQATVEVGSPVTKVLHPTNEVQPLHLPEDTVPTPVSSPPKVIPQPSPAPSLREVQKTEPLAGPSVSPSPSSRPLSSTRKVSTFRHVPLRPANSRPPTPSSPLRSAASITRDESTPASPLRQSSTLPLRAPGTPSRTVSSSSTIRSQSFTPSLPALDLPVQSPQPYPAQTHSMAHPHIEPPPRVSSLSVPPPPPQKSISPGPGSVPVSPASAPSPASSSVSLPAFRQPTRPPAPYRPGFQPKGVYRPRTDEFVELRRSRRDQGRIERTRLERRLEKLIDLHFPHPDKQRAKEQRGTEKLRPPQQQNRRASSFFDLDFSDLRSKSASDLWKGIVQSQTPGGKGDIRSAEQTITPWEDDASVSQCPLCSAPFHPLTNRKHHCRLCGQIICSLPIKHPQRSQPCSLLFVADPLTGAIEEVEEGVDYGVRRRTPSTVKGKARQESIADEEKFLKGVRICRECRPVVLYRQYAQEMHRIPLFVRLYEAFIILEKEIEDALPQFQELMLSLSNEERPTPEASLARKRLLEAFAQYDALAKRINKLPSHQGGSQDRVQMAIVSRANAFLQKHMFPLQALPTPKKSSTVTESAQEGNKNHVIDPDSEVAKVLQPLLEQEALLEGFVEEAKAHRKFEDAKTLKRNLKEIQAEIDRVLANAELSR